MIKGKTENKKSSQIKYCIAIYYSISYIVKHT